MSRTLIAGLQNRSNTVIRKGHGPLERSRTSKIWFLRPTRMPVPSPGVINWSVHSESN